MIKPMKMKCFSIFKESLKNPSVPSKSYFWEILTHLLAFVLILLVFASCQNSVVARRDAFSVNLSEIGQKTTSKNLALRFTSTASPGETKTTSFFSPAYSVYRNYDKACPYIYVSDEKAAPLTFSLSTPSGGYELTNSTQLFTLSNMSNTKKFESLNLELLKQISGERDATGFDGVVYLPDYLADKIIENSNGLYSTYDALLDSRYGLTMSCAGKSRRYRLANIFYTANFAYASSDESYQKKDNGNGKLMKSFLGDFVFTQDRYFFNTINSSFGSVFASRQFMIKGLGETVFQAFPKGQVSASFLYQETTDLVAYADSQIFSEIYYSGVSSFGPFVWPCLIPLAALLPLFVFSMIQRHKYIRPSIKLALFEVIPSFLLLGVFEAVAAIFPMGSLSLLLFFNVFGNVLYLVYLLYIFLEAALTKSPLSPRKEVTHELAFDNLKIG